MFFMVIIFIIAQFYIQLLKFNFVKKERGRELFPSVTQEGNSPRGCRPHDLPRTWLQPVLDVRFRKPTLRAENVNSTDDHFSRQIKITCYFTMVEIGEGAKRLTRSAESPWTHPLRQLYRTEMGVGGKRANHHMYQLNKSTPFRWQGKGLFYWAKHSTNLKILLNWKIESTWSLKGLLSSYQAKDDLFKI